MLSLQRFNPCPSLTLHLLVLLALLVGLQTAGYAAQPPVQPPVTVEISGQLTEQQRNNINSSLSLTRLAGTEAWSEAFFNELYGKAGQEAAKALEPFGYYSPEITLSHQQADKHNKVTLVVVLGVPVTVTEVDITLVGAGAHDEALRKAVASFPLQGGSLLDHQGYEDGKDALITQALDQGYQGASFRRSQVLISKKNHSAAVHIQLDTGPQYRFGRISFEAEAIDQDLLAKVAPVRAGDPFSPKSLTRLRQSLFNTGYFKTVELEYDLEQSTENRVPLRVVLTPNLAHKYGVGLGYATDTGIRGTLEYANRSLNRAGHQLDMQLQPAERKNNLSGAYTIPLGDPKKDRLTLAAKYQTEQFDNTDTQTLNTSVGPDHFREWGEYSMYLQYLNEHYSIGAEDGQAALFIPGVRGSLFWADDRIATKQGLRLSASVIGSEKALGADASFLQTTLRAKSITTFFDQWRCIGRADIGTTLVDDISHLPPTLRYYAGGDQSVRGYGYKKIGPTDAEGNILGGVDLLVYSLELERTLFEAWSGALFYDSGTATNSFSSISMHSGAGVGVRWNGVFGQIRLDLARALDEEGSWRIHFTMGADL